jgi:hypothetical protein
MQSSRNAQVHIAHNEYKKQAVFLTQLMSLWDEINEDIRVKRFKRIL